MSSLRKTLLREIVLCVVILLAAIPGWSQTNNGQISASPTSLLEGPSAGAYGFIVFTSGFSDSEFWTVTSTVPWITVQTSSLSGNGFLSSNGGNHLPFTFTANTGPTRAGTIVIASVNGSSGATINVTQAGASFTPAGLLTLLTQLNGPTGIAADNSGNVYFTSTPQQTLYIWNPLNPQTLGQILFAPLSPLDVKLDAAGDLFVLAHDFTTNQQLLYQLAAPIPLSTIYQSTGEYGPNFLTQVNSENTAYGPALCVDQGGNNTYTVSNYYSNSCAVDPIGNVYQTDTGNRVVGVTSLSTGTNTLITGSHLIKYQNYLIWTQPSMPYALSSDLSGNIYYTDLNGTHLNRVDPVTYQSTVVRHRPPLRPLFVDG